MSKPEPLTAEQKIAIARASINAVRSGIKNPAVYDRATHRAVSVETLRSFETALRLVVDGRVDRIAKAFAEDRIADIEELLK